MVGILVDHSVDDARAFQRRHSLSYPVLSDPGLKAYSELRRGDLLSTVVSADTAATPYNVVLDRQGKVRYRTIGFDEKAVQRLVEELLLQ